MRSLLRFLISSNIKFTRNIDWHFFSVFFSFFLFHTCLTIIKLLTKHFVTLFSFWLRFCFTFILYMTIRTCARWMFELYEKTVELMGTFDSSTVRQRHVQQRRANERRSERGNGRTSGALFCLSRCRPDSGRRSQLVHLSTITSSLECRCRQI